MGVALLGKFGWLRGTSLMVFPAGCSLVGPLLMILMYSNQAGLIVLSLKYVNCKRVGRYSLFQQTHLGAHQLRSMG